LPLVLTSNTYENGKNERSHQDPSMCEALLNESADVSRVLFPADFNSAAAALTTCFHTRGRIFSLVVPKSATIPNLFSKIEAQQLMETGGIRFAYAQPNAQLLLTAIGAFQMIETLRAAERLEQRGLRVLVNYLIEPGRFRTPRGRREAAFCAPDERREQLFPKHITHRVFVSHTHPETMSGVLRPLDTGRTSIFLGYANHGGTLDTAGALFVNRLSWAHIVRAASRSLGVDLKRLLDVDEIAALNGQCNPQGVLFA
jgi:phosphoketolase